LQREIAHVMASCAMRGMRYISFPPIVFETPAPVPVPGEPVEALPPAEALVQVPPPAALPPKPPMLAAPPQPIPAPEMAAPSMAPIITPTPAPMGPPPAMRRLQEWADAAPEPAPPTPPGRLRRLTELAAAESLAPSDAQSRPRYALLADIAVELRPRRVRARTGRSRTP